MYNIILLFLIVLFRIERLPSVIRYVRSGVDSFECDGLIFNYVSELVYC